MTRESLARLAPAPIGSRLPDKVNAALATELHRFLVCAHPPTLLCLFSSASGRPSLEFDHAPGNPVTLHTTMAAAAVDVGYLAASYSIPEATIHSLLSQPTVELVQSLLTELEVKARDFEDLQSEKLKADVELDNAVQSGEQRARTLKAAAEKAQKEAEELRQKVTRAGMYTAGHGCWAGC